ncbi:MAG TPA: DUF72 domain-containing protein [Polyangiaceae bacterium]|nr:DUF72 domain-containing protein [Polyangiaceae bacterium]
MSKTETSQPILFTDLVEPPAADSKRRKLERLVLPAPVRPELVELAAALPAHVSLGTMSWSYPGWRGVVYAADADAKQLAKSGLRAYVQNPLLTAVEIDRTYYEPVPVEALRAYAEQVPAGFRFVVKAHEACVVQRFPTHPRYGKRAGEQNPLYLDAAHAVDNVVQPALAALGEKLGVVVFQFPPEDVGAPAAFARRLGAFLQRLPAGAVYAVELRNRALFGAEYAAALVDAGAVHCHNVWGDMPSASLQARQLAPPTRRPLLVRWLMRRGESYQSAGERYLPFDRLVEEDVPNREDIARLVARAAEHGVPSFVMLDNKAEGCAPETAVRLARAIVAARRPSAP